MTGRCGREDRKKNQGAILAGNRHQTQELMFNKESKDVPPVPRVRAIYIQG